MLLEMTVGASAAMAGGFAYAKGKRNRLYRRLADRTAAISSANPIAVAAQGRALPSFADRLAVITNVLEQASFERVRAEAERHAAAERSYVPAHKKGGTVAYETLIESSPSIVALYHAPALKAIISGLCGAGVVPTPFKDQSSLSILFYDKPGDHIGWHYDHNFYRGRHFTVLLPVINEGHGPDRLSHARLIARIGEEDRAIATPPNTLIVFEGAKVRHKVVPIAENERRLVISMTYCTDPSANVVQGAARRVKDTAYFGLRALWT